MKVIKRNDSEQEFDLKKIERAIEKANKCVPEEERMDSVSMQKVVNTVLKKMEGYTTINVSDIHDFIERSLIRHNKASVARAYIVAHEQKLKDKKFTPTEEKALSLLNGTSELRGDNANKHIDDNGSIRDYLAGLLCKALANKMLPKDVLKAHNDGLIHYHDLDYSPVQPLHNCDLANAADMFKNGFQMGDTKIEPNSGTPFRTACNLLAQINLIISGRQYGGQTVSWSHLLPFVENSRNIIRTKIKNNIANKNWLIRQAYKLFYTDKQFEKEVNKALREEIYEGVKTYQYQILSHMSSNGQTPFVSNNLCLREAETKQELDDLAMIIEEIFKRRIKGVKDSSGMYVTPLFPKLLYWVSEGLNLKEGDPYFYLTELAADCEIARTQPDINSEKECRRIKDGQIIPSMGCRSLLGPIWEERTYPIDTKFYWVYTNRNMNKERKCEYPYGLFVEKKDFKNVKSGDYKIGYDEGEIAINFRGNTGWLKSKNDKEVVIYEPIVYGRFNQGVVTVNIPHVALEAKQVLENESNEYSLKDLENKFFEIFDERLELCRKALKTRNASVKKIKGKNSPILWQHGALTRIGADETVGDFMTKHPKWASISLGFVGLFETCRALIGESNTSKDGIELSKRILTFMNKKCDEWKVADGLNYSIYGTPEESLTYKFALANRKDFGLIPYVTDKDYVVNSYHVDPREEIDAFTKLEIEGQYLALSPGGAVSYVETLDLKKNKKVIISIIQWMYEHILYAEFNRKIGVCHVCGYEGDIELIKTEDGEFKFRCPSCGNEDDNKMDVTARLCGYLGKVNAGNANKGRIDDIYNRVIHLDNFEDNAIK